MQAVIKELMDEHQVILRMLGVLEGMSARLSSSSRAVLGPLGSGPGAARLEEGKEVDPADLESAVDFVKSFADYAHHGKEEDLLFPAMEEAGISRDGGPIGVMLTEHGMGRDYVRGLTAAVEGLRKGDKGAAAKAAENALNYAELLRDHIYKEDNILYPMSMQCVPSSRFKALEKEFSRVEAERMGPKKREGYVALVERLEKAYPAPEGCACSCESGGCCG